MQVCLNRLDALDRFERSAKDTALNKLLTIAVSKTIPACPIRIIFWTLQNFVSAFQRG